MANGFTIQFQGMDKVLSSVKGLGAKVQREVEGEFKDAADRTAAIASRKAPADHGASGGILGAIVANKTNSGYEVVVHKNYAAFIEFGTKSKFNPTPGSAGYASQFQGKSVSGPGLNPIDVLTEWVHRKGIAGTYSVKSRRRTGNAQTQSVQDRQLAFVIWRSIRKYGIKAHPYLFPAFFEVGEDLPNRIKVIVAEAVKK